MSQPYTCAPSSARYSSGIGAGACVQYERHLVASTTPGSSSAPFGHASMHSVHEPRAVPAGDQHRVLAVEADPGPCRRLPVDVLVRIDEDAVLAAQAPPELIEPFAQHGITVVPRVTREPSFARLKRGFGGVVAVCRRDDHARTGQKR